MPGRAHGAGDQPEHDRRSDRCGNNRQGHAPAIAGAGAREPDVDCVRQRRGLLLLEYRVVADADHAAAGRSAPAGRVRAAVRRRRHRRRAPRRQPQDGKPSGFGHRGCRPPAAASGAIGPRARHRVSRLGARARARAFRTPRARARRRSTCPSDRPTSREHSTNTLS